MASLPFLPTISVTVAAEVLSTASLTADEKKLCINKGREHAFGTKCTRNTEICCRISYKTYGKNAVTWLLAIGQNALEMVHESNL